MKRTQVIIVAVVAASLTGCMRTPEWQNSRAATRPSLEPQHGQRVSVFGTIASDPVPTLKLTSHRVDNGRNIVRLKQPGSKAVFPFAEGTAVHISGIFLSQNLKVPELTVEAIEEKIGLAINNEVQRK